MEELKRKLYLEQWPNLIKKTGKASCVIVGMGRAGVGANITYKPTLQKLSMKIKPHVTSMYKYFIPDQSWGVITESTEGGGKGGCNGDSGGPFFCTINGVRKQFGVASWADLKCGSMTGWYIPAAVLPWIKQNSNYGGGSGGSSSSSSSSNSHNRQTTHNQYQQNQQQNRHNQQRHTTSHNSHQSNSGSNSQSAQRVKKELQKLRSQFDQMLALL